MKKILHWFNSLPYKFKGAILGISIPLAFFLLATFTSTILSEVFTVYTFRVDDVWHSVFLYNLYNFLQILNGIFGLIAFPFGNGSVAESLFSFGVPTYLIFVFIFAGFIFYPIFGYILGWIIDEFKKSKQPLS